MSDYAELCSTHACGDCYRCNLDTARADLDRAVGLLRRWHKAGAALHPDHVSCDCLTCSTKEIVRNLDTRSGT